ncbi:phosphopyruvate hydratase [Candidatus Gottesmanbacteria bacterium]|nr:phosphopyruvate hydratase [Candidatus Gottesmanbacteria bacterium]
MKIDRVKPYQILDSRGNPTIAVEITANNISASAMVPSGASTGKHEALELRDGGKDYSGKGVLKALSNILSIYSQLKPIDILNQTKIDKAMITLDGTSNKSNLGANAILALSMAVARLSSKSKNMPLFSYLGRIYEVKQTNILPTPMLNVLNGGTHTDWQGPDIQEFMIVPFAAHTFTQAIQWSSEIYHTLKKLLKNRGYSTLVGDEGGFAPNLKTNEEAVQLLIDAISNAGYNKKVGIAIDAAASAFYDQKENLYNLRKENKKFSTKEMISFWEDMINKYPQILSLEDGLAEDDWDGWVGLTQRLGNRIQIVGDDLLVTNPERIKKAIKLKACNALLVKLNQIGTLTETFEAIKICKKAGWNNIISHRSGETEDTFIADLSVGTCCDQIKTGAPARSERVAKYNRLLKIEEELAEMGLSPQYAGNAAFSRS